MAQLIVALDVPSADEAERLIDQLYELDLIFKIGMESLYGYPERIFSYCERATYDTKWMQSCTIFRVRSLRLFAFVRRVPFINVHALTAAPDDARRCESAETLLNSALRCRVSPSRFSQVMLRRTRRTRFGGRERT